MISITPSLLTIKGIHRKKIQKIFQVEGKIKHTHTNDGIKQHELTQKLTPKTTVNNRWSRTIDAASDAVCSGPCDGLKQTFNRFKIVVLFTHMCVYHQVSCLTP